jgi:hypothetical protein
VLDKFFPYQQKTFAQIPISITFGEPGAVVALGPRILISDESNQADKAVIYQIDPSTGTVMVTTRLNGTDCIGFTIVQTRPEQQSVLCPNRNTGSVDIYDFPQGGNATGHITGLQYPVAVAISRIPPLSPAPSSAP